MARIDPRKVEVHGGSATIRTATPGDAAALLELHTMLSGETDFLANEPDELRTTLDEQAASPGDDFQSCVIRMPWTLAVPQGAFGALAGFLLGPGGAYPRTIAACVGWATYSTFLLSAGVGFVGRSGLRVGSVNLRWSEIRDPFLDRRRLRITGPSGMHFHLPPVVFRDERYARHVTELAPAGHALAVFLRDLR